jgi:hypothetical protein
MGVIRVTSVVMAVRFQIDLKLQGYAIHRFSG